MNYKLPTLSNAAVNCFPENSGYNPRVRDKLIECLLICDGNEGRGFQDLHGLISGYGPETDIFKTLANYRAS
jgi:hypothetical protein